MNLEMKDVHLVVMAGGSGTRFWPKSTSDKPKQFLTFGSKKTLIEQTLDRFKDWVPQHQVWVVTTKNYVDRVREVLGPNIRVLAEPEGRNTAPCVFWAAREIEKSSPDAIMMVMPSDHTIEDNSAYVKVVQKAVRAARESDALYTLGVKPTHPETGYGYLKLGEKSGDVYQLDAFVEKPDLGKAKQYIESGNYLWNAGMFVWKVSSVLKEFHRQLPDYGASWNDTNVAQSYTKLKTTSIDFGIMENAENVCTLQLDCGWNDLGSWTALDQTLPEREFGRVLEGEVISVESKGNIVDAPGRLVALLGVEGLVIVEHGNKILIAKKSEAQKIKDLVEKVRNVNSGYN